MKKMLATFFVLMSINLLAQDGNGVDRDGFIQPPRPIGPIIPIDRLPTPQIPAEVLYGVDTSHEGITIRVYTGGCTYKNSFDVNMESVNVPVGPRRPAFYVRHDLTFFRTSPDYCKAYIPEGKEIFFSYEELGIERGNKFRVLNPIGGFAPIAFPPLTPIDDIDPMDAE